MKNTLKLVAIGIICFSVSCCITLFLQSIEHTNSDFNLKNKQGIEKVVSELSDLWKNKQELNIEDAKLFCKKIIDGPWDKVDINLVDFSELNPEISTSKLGGYTGGNFRKNGSKYIIKILNANSVGFKNDVLFHEIGHLLDYRRHVGMFGQSKVCNHSLRREAYARSVTNLLNKIFYKCMPEKVFYGTRSIADPPYAGASMDSYKIVFGVSKELYPDKVFLLNTEELYRVAEKIKELDNDKIIKFLGTGI